MHFFDDTHADGIGVRHMFYATVLDHSILRVRLRHLSSLSGYEAFMSVAK